MKSIEIKLGDVLIDKKYNTSAVVHAVGDSEAHDELLEQYIVGNIKEEK